MVYTDYPRYYLLISDYRDILSEYRHYSAARDTDIVLDNVAGVYIDSSIDLDALVL